MTHARTPPSSAWSTRRSSGGGPAGRPVALDERAQRGARDQRGVELGPQLQRDGVRDDGRLTSLPPRPRRRSGGRAPGPGARAARKRRSRWRTSGWPRRRVAAAAAAVERHRRERHREREDVGRLGAAPARSTSGAQQMSVPTDVIVSLASPSESSLSPSDADASLVSSSRRSASSPPPRAPPPPRGWRRTARPRTREQPVGDLEPVRLRDEQVRRLEVAAEQAALPRARAVVPVAQRVEVVMPRGVRRHGASARATAAPRSPRSTRRSEPLLTNSRR